MIEIHHTDKTRLAYNQIYDSPAIHQMDSFFIWVCSILKIGPGSSILDVATGRGQMVEFAHKSGATAFGIDFSMTACQIASQQEPGKIVCSDGQKLPFSDQSFDFVTNLGSLEHFEHMETGVQEMARVVKPGGKACVVVPNTFGLRWNVQYAWRTGDVDDDGQPLQRYGTRKQWEQLLRSNGLEVIQVLGYEHERAYPRTGEDLINYLKHPRRLLSMLLVAPLVPVNAAGQFVFICKPLPVAKNLSDPEDRNSNPA
jgi:2-polyprenyl-3-methyl-5-hydroxy-6-metoxy-1,4-benzoquinol methylase